MSTNNFIKRTIIKAVLLIIAAIIISTVSVTIDTIISNNLALGQMENDDGLYVMMELYQNTLQPILTLVFTIVIVTISFTIGLDIYKFIKTKMNGEKENEKD